ncbi:MAG: cation diffusion facilitator family transporter [Mycobacteriales bacterium]
MSLERRLRVALWLNAAIVAAQVAGGLVGHSLGLLADAGHNLTDVAAVLVSIVALRLSARPPTPQRSFGYHRGTILAAQANAAAILAVTALIGIGAVGRLLHPRAVTGSVVLGVALAAAVANAVAALVLHRDRADLSARSVLLHTAGDALASLGVAGVGAVLLADPALRWLDPAVSLAIGGLIAARAVGLLRETADVLLESTPPGLDLAAVAVGLASDPQVVEVHDLHVWALSSQVRALSAHLVLAGHPTLEEAQATGDRVKRGLDAFGISHATLELECEACAPEGTTCAMEALPVAGRAR